MILVPLILLGSLGIAAVIFSRKEGSSPAPRETSGSILSSDLQKNAEMPSPNGLSKSTEVLKLATQLEDLLRNRMNGTPGTPISNSMHDLKLAQELKAWTEWEQGLHRETGEEHPR